MTELLKAFCLMFDVDVANVTPDSEQPNEVQYEFVDKGGSHVLTIWGDEIAEFMDRATGHLPPYRRTDYAEFTDQHYVWR